MHLNVIKIIEDELLALTRQFSEDARNLSVEFNEFLKMKAFHKNNLTVRNSGELEEAFRLKIDLKISNFIHINC